MQVRGGLQFCGLVAEAAEASREVGRSPEYCEQRSTRTIGLPDPALSSAISRRSAVFLALPSPGLLRVQVHPLVSFPSSSEFVAAFYLPSVRGCPLPRGACSRVRFPFATSVREVHLPASFPPWPTFRPQRFARSRRLTPSRTLQACFILLPRPGFTLQGFSPLPSRFASSASRALVSFG